MLSSLNDKMLVYYTVKSLSNNRLGSKTLFFIQKMSYLYNYIGVLFRINKFSLLKHFFIIGLLVQKGTFVHL